MYFALDSVLVSSLTTTVFPLPSVIVVTVETLIRLGMSLELAEDILADRFFKSSTASGDAGSAD